MNKTICVVSGSRAEYGLLRPLLWKIHSDSNLTLQFVVTGSHLSEEFGGTEAEIQMDGIPITDRIKIPLNVDSKSAMTRATAETLAHFADYFEHNSSDLLILLGDRFEIFAVATAAAMTGIPIAHIHGGETTEGAVDEFLRHSITKMSVLHFVACEQYRKRVIQLGECPEHVFSVGALGVENSIQLPLWSLEELQRSLNFKLDGKSYSVVTFHPVTMENNTVETQLMELIEALDSFPHMKFIITKANADAGGRMINHIWDVQSQVRNNWLVVSSLGAIRYLTALKYAKMMIGNSSSGIIEAPAMKIPTVNIGNRQKGRMMAESILCCEPNKNMIIATIKKAQSREFQAIASKVKNPFGDGNTSERILTEIKKAFLDGEINTQKKFYDIKFEVVK